MPADFRRVLARALATSPLLLPGCQRPPPAVAPDPAPGSVQAALEPAPSVATAEVEPGFDQDGPRVRSARFIDPQHVRLEFSEALAPTDGVNPRQFRISSVYMTVEGDGYAYATYSDLSYQDGEDAPALVVKGLKRYGDERSLGLVLSGEVPNDVCAELNDMARELEEQAAYYSAAETAAEPGPVIRGGLFLHYTERGSLGVSDLAGNTLEGFGASWALNFGTSYMSQNGRDPVARLDLLVEVPCFEAQGYGEGYEASYEVPAGGVQGPPPGPPPPSP